MTCSRTAGSGNTIAAGDRLPGMPSPQLAALARDIERETGLNVAPADARLESALSVQCGTTAGALPHAPQWDAVVENLLVHETYFFRHPRQLDVIEKSVLPELRDLAARDGRNHLSIWSASCSTGEEAWTMALIADAAMAASGFSFKVYGSDLSASVLETARRAVYRRAASLGSFRNLSAAQLKRFPGLDVGAQNWSPSAGLRRRVHLFRHNLLDRAPLGSLDLILCRNTLIYMSRDARRRIVGHFAALLRPGGYLAMGPAETPEGDVRFAPAGTNDALLFRRNPDTGPASAPWPAVPQPAPSTPRDVLLIGASTGGPDALIALLAALGPPKMPVIVAIHMPADQTAVFATHLSTRTGLNVVEAMQGHLPPPGHVAVLKGGTNYRIERSTAGFMLRRSLAEAGPYRPCIDMLFGSAVDAGLSCDAVVLSGMGDDGAAGAARIEAAGGRVLVQRPESCVVAGMPLATLAACRTAQALTPAAIAAKLARPSPVMRTGAP